MYVKYFFFQFQFQMNEEVNLDLEGGGESIGSRAWIEAWIRSRIGFPYLWNASLLRVESHLVEPQYATQIRRGGGRKKKDIA